ncbi:MAG: hypothetical protein LBQ63_05850 [Deltaproteobacteria bacterium]|jgi:hypothetical protein|nr:hypothetical protein [Deltaproteobacteria bacterium]
MPSNSQRRGHVKDVPIRNGCLFHVLHPGSLQNGDGVYWFDNTWNILDTSVNLAAPDTPGLVKAAAEALPGTAVTRDAAGRARISSPAAGGEIANKEYVDGVALGVGQSWRDMRAGRAVNAAYVNATGRPIFVNVRANYTPAAGYGVTLEVDNLAVDGNTAAYSSLQAIVPPGSTYAFKAPAQLNISSFSWFELR